jgi:thiol-disulfide isomerase/thioredoxin
MPKPKADKQKKVRLTLFHMNGCGPCAMFRPEWNKLVAKLSNKKNIGVDEVEMNQMGGLSEKDRSINGQEIEGFPTLKIVIDRKEYAYAGARNADAILQFVLKNMKQQLYGGADDEESKEEEGDDEPAEDEENEEGEGEGEEEGEGEGDDGNNHNQNRQSSARSSIFSKDSSQTDYVQTSSVTSNQSNQPNQPNRSTNNNVAVGGSYITSEFDRLLSKEISTLSDIFRL